eukprot:10973887-Heterocapsa_arctica.AAC.1
MWASRAGDDVPTTGDHLLAVRRRAARIQGVVGMLEDHDLGQVEAARQRVVDEEGVARPGQEELR